LPTAFCQLPTFHPIGLISGTEIHRFFKGRNAKIPLSFVAIKALTYQREC
jgi:hypothetical protein